MNLKELRDMVRASLDEPDEQGFFSNDEINRWLNEAQKDIALKTKHLKDSVYRIMESNVTTFQLPIDYIEMHKVIRNGKRLKKIAMEEAEDKAGYYTWKDELNVYPPGNGSDKLKLFYFRSPQKMQDDEDDPEVPYAFRDMMIQFACYKAKIKDRHPEEAQMFYEDYMQDVAEMQQKFRVKPYKKKIKVER